MSESKSFLVTIMKWHISGQEYKHLASFSRFVLFEASTLQRLTLSAASVLSLKVCLYTFISCCLKKIIK